MDALRDRLMAGDLVRDVRRLLQGGAEDHGRWLRENLRHAMTIRREDVVAVSGLTGLAPGTVRGFLNGRPSSINNVLLMAEAVGYTVAELDRPPEEFQLYAQVGRDGGEGTAIGASLLAFEESPTAMAIVLLDGTIVKVNRKLRDLIGYDEGELVGAPAATFSLSSSEVQTERREELTATDALRRTASQLRRKDGSIVDVVSSAIVVRDRDGQPRYVIARSAVADGAPRAEAGDDVTPDRRSHHGQ
jgi:PAS domain S-box-containing protein